MEVHTPPVDTQQSSSNRVTFLCTKYAVVPQKQLKEVLHDIELFCAGRDVKQQMLHHEQVYKLDAKSTTYASLRTWRDMNIPGPTDSTGNPTQPQWYLRHVEAAREPYQHDCLVLPIKDVTVSSNFRPFVKFLGYTFDYEYVQRGYRFIDERTHVEFAVYQLCRLTEPGDVSSIVTISAVQSWVVELRTIVPEANIGTVDKFLLDIAQQLPSMHFHKVLPQ